MAEVLLFVLLLLRGNELMGVKRAWPCVAADGTSCCRWVAVSRGWRGLSSELVLA